MATSYVDYTGDGSTNVFNVPFDYLDRSHVEVFVDSASVTFQFLTGSSVSLDQTPANGQVIRVSRNTARQQAVDFENGSRLIEEDLDKVAKQSIFLAEEASDQIFSALSEDTDGRLDAEGRTIKNLPTPSSPDHAVTKAYADQVIDDTFAARDDAEAARDSAEASLTSFEQAYLGEKSSPPAVDNDGNALRAGAVYWDTSESRLFIWDGASWGEAVFDVSGALVAENNLSELTDPAAARSNLALGTMSVEAAADYTPRSWFAAGTTRPGGITKGGVWSRDNGDGTVSLLIYDGAQDVEVATVQRTLATSDWEAGASTTESLVSPAKIRDAIPPALNATGSAPIYACRAWVNFDGTGTVSIRDSGNVSSVTDNGVGDYTVNFNTALVDTDYAVVTGGQRPPSDNEPAAIVSVDKDTASSTNSVRVITQNPASTRRDLLSVYFAIIR